MKKPTLMQDLQHLLTVVLWTFGALSAIAVAWFGWRFRGAVKAFLPKPRKALPKHKLELKSVDPRWTDEAVFQKELQAVYDEVQNAVNSGDLETLEVITQGQALAFWRSQLQTRVASEPGVADQREIFKGATLQSWQSAGKKATVLFTVSRWRGGWKIVHEQWLMEKRGGAWFVLERQKPNL